MSPVNDVALILEPLLLGGGAAVAASAASAAGADLYSRSTALLGKIRGQLRGRSVRDIELALDAALERGEVDMRELLDLCASAAQVNQNFSGSHFNARNIFTGVTNIDTFNG